MKIENTISIAEHNGFCVQVKDRAGLPTIYVTRTDTPQWEGIFQSFQNAEDVKDSVNVFEIVAEAYCRWNEVSHRFA